LVVGAVLASSHHYFEHASTLKPILSALLAVVLWPPLRSGGAFGVVPLSRTV
jgi:hypothetical protein